MDTRTRSIKAAKRAAKTKETNLDDTWDVPGLKGNASKSRIIKTYSKKTPYNMVVRQHIEEEELFSESEQKTGNCSASAFVSKRKQKRSGKKLTRMSSCKKKNKTTVSLASMSPCTVLNFTDNDDSIDQPMSLCSIAKRIDEISCGTTARNSTLLANNDGHIDIDFVPDNISAIQGDKSDNQTIISNYNEWTPMKQAIENVPTLSKKVTFSINGKIGQKSKVGHFRKPTDADMQSILKKPYLASDSIENPYQECHIDITPETCNPSKSFCGTQRRRLSYFAADETVPTCILLDLPHSKGKKAAVWSGKSADLIKLEELDSFPTDILL